MQKNSLLFLILLLLFSCGEKVNDTDNENINSIGLNEQDSLIMVKFHESMGGFGWDLGNCKTWKGVSFIYDEATQKSYVNIIAFGMGSMKGKGTIPREIGGLPKLEHFIIQDPQWLLTGELPNDIFNCPLVTFRVEADGIYGKFDSSVGKIAKTIRSFWVSGTMIGGELPSEFGLFQNLKSSLYLPGNQFSGKLPKTFNSIPKGVVLFQNNISSVDWDFFDIDINSSWSVVLKENKLDGIIPDHVLTSPVWKKWHNDFANQQEGYGFSNWQ